MKLLLIKLFRLKHLEEVIYRAMRKQQDADEKSHKRELNRLHDEHEYNMKLLRQSSGAKIRMLENKIVEWESRESEMVNREYKSNAQIKVNYEVMTAIVTETSKIHENIGKLQSVYDQVSIQNHKLNKEIGHDF
jgi:hypothetical protein